jgi:hypothetical protein
MLVKHFNKKKQKKILKKLPSKFIQVEIGEPKNYKKKIGTNVSYVC